MAVKERVEYRFLGIVVWSVTRYTDEQTIIDRVTEKVTSELKAAIGAIRRGGA